MAAPLPARLVFRDWLALPVAVPVVQGCERPGVHAIEVERASEMVNLVLKDARVPPGGFDVARLGVFVEEFHANGVGARHHCGETRQAEAAFEEVAFVHGHLHDSGIDEDVKRDGAAFFLQKILRRQSFQKILAIFDDRELQRESDLRSGETDTGRVDHGLLHVSNEPLRFFAEDFLWGEDSGGLPQDRVTGLHNFQPQDCLPGMTTNSEVTIAPRHPYESRGIPECMRRGRRSTAMKPSVAVYRDGR